MKQYDLIVGHDNGNSGGTVALRTNYDVVRYIANPVTSKFSMDTVDMGALVGFVQSLKVGRVLFVAEEPLKRLISSTPSMWNNFGAVRAVMSMQPNVDFLAVGVKEWQLVMLGRVPKGQTKKVALAQAKKFWPEERWLATDRSRTPHDGIVDAALIARYTIQNYETRRHSGSP